MPGLVNAHTHLELSYLREQVPAGSSFVAWIRAVMAARRQYPDPKAPAILDAIDRGIAEALRSGTAIVGDISNTLVTFEPHRPQSARGGDLLRADRVSCARSRGGRRARHAADRGAVADRSRSREPGRARAVLGRAARVAGDPARAGSRSVRDLQRASGGVGRGSRVHPHRRRTVARAARGARRVGCGLGGTRCQPGSVSG